MWILPPPPSHIMGEGERRDPLGAGGQTLHSGPNTPPLRLGAFNPARSQRPPPEDVEGAGRCPQSCHFEVLLNGTDRPSLFRNET